MAKRKPKDEEKPKGCPYGDPDCTLGPDDEHEDCTPPAGDGDVEDGPEITGLNGDEGAGDDDQGDAGEAAAEPPVDAGPTEGTRPGAPARPPLRFISVPNVDGVRLESSGQRIALVFESKGATADSPDVEIIVALAGKHLDALQGLLKNADFKSKEAVVYSARFPRPENTQLEMAL